MTTTRNTLTIRRDQPTGELGTVAGHLAVREPDGTVWAFTAESEWTLVRNEWTLVRTDFVAAMFTPEL